MEARQLTGVLKEVATFRLSFGDLLLKFLSHFRGERLCHAGNVFVLHRPKHRLHRVFRSAVAYIASGGFANKAFQIELRGHSVRLVLGNLRAQSFVLAGDAFQFLSPTREAVHLISQTKQFMRRRVGIRCGCDCGSNNLRVGSFALLRGPLMLCAQVTELFALHRNTGDCQGANSDCGGDYYSSHVHRLGGFDEVALGLGSGQLPSI